MKIFLTGASGMVGRNILEHPNAARFEFLAPTHQDLDLLDYQQVLYYLNNTKPDLIVHAAGRVGGIQANMAQPVEFLVENLAMAENIILAAKASRISQLLFLGSSCLYPRDIATPLTEDMILTGPLEPTNEGYALAKIVGAKLCQYISATEPAFQYKTLIPCNLYGRWDKFDPQHSHMIPAVIHKTHQAMVNQEDSVEIWGDGTARREFMYAGDLADCIIEALNRFESLPPLMNVGLGVDYTIDQYYETISGMVDFQGKLVHNKTKPVGMQRKLVSVEKMTAWGWQPKTTLEEGIRQTYQFYLEQKESHCYEPVSSR